MATNGNSLIKSKNGNGRGSGGRVRDECLGFFGAELVSMGTSLGVVAVVDQLIPKPILDQTYKTVGKILEPWLLDPYESVLRHLCSLEECKVDQEKSRQQRAESMAKVLLVFGAAWAISLNAKLYTRRGINKLIGIHEPEPVLSKDASFVRKAFNKIIPWETMNAQERMIFTADEAVHYGSIFLMNKPLAGATDEMIRSAKNIIKKTTGASDQKAQEIADMGVIWELPNFLGMISGFGAIAAKHYLHWPDGQAALKTVFHWPGNPSHAGKLAQSTSLSSLTPHK